jgi:ectoine hydroxylase-related dioxygenase (phytanoyl-CoA dioxygenase family)
LISTADVAFYRREGYLVVPDVLSPAEVAELSRVTDDLVRAAAAVERHDAIYDLEDGHSRATPMVRRIKTPHRHHAAYEALVRHPKVLEVLKPLIGEGIRFDTGKLNLKAAGFGASVEWHQDWAFYPHTNDDLCAVGYMIDDMELENGPLLVIPGSHLGPVYDHHSDGRFCGAIDPVATGLDASGAVPLTGRAGSITVHHARLLHASAPNRSARPRRLLLNQYSAADAWPLRGTPDFAAWTDSLLTGSFDGRTRMTAVPVKIPYPVALSEGSIYEAQRGLANRFFDSGTAPLARAG